VVAASGPCAPLQAHEIPRVKALDRLATGEDRTHLLELLPHGWIASGGFALRTPWGFGPVIAEDAASGEALLDTLRAYAEADLTLRVPDSNDAAMHHLQRNGFAEVGGLPRMRLGEPVAWHPR
jgi:Acetyltransferase (GNAT) domain